MAFRARSSTSTTAPIVALGGALCGDASAGRRLLDLMSSWRSHLPPGFRPATSSDWVERRRDGRQSAAHRPVVHDVNRETRLPFDDAEFDGGMCAVSIQYVTHPVRLLREVRRVLRPGAPFVVSFSNRCFPTKAVAVWLDTTDHSTWGSCAPISTPPAVGPT